MRKCPNDYPITVRRLIELLQALPDQDAAVVFQTGAFLTPLWKVYSSTFFELFGEIRVYGRLIEDVPQGEQTDPTSCVVLS